MLKGCQGGAKEVLRKEPKRCQGGAKKVSRSILGDAKEVRKRCQGGACPLVARSCPLVAASKTISRGQKVAKPHTIIGDYDKVCMRLKQNKS